MGENKLLLVTLLTCAVFAFLFYLLFTDVITTTLLWYLALGSLSLGVTVYILGAIFVKILEKNGCYECGVFFLVFLGAALYLIVPSIILMFILCVIECSIRFIPADFFTWLILALFILGIVWSAISIVIELFKR